MMVMELWDNGRDYETYMGRWSRLVAREFVKTLKPGGRWLDIGCGTGALTQAVLDFGQPDWVTSTDRSPAFVDHVQRHIQDQRVQFATADATRLPFADGAFSQVVSGLVLNFLPESAVAELWRVTAAAGSAAAYVWDYAGKMEWLRYFWDAAVTVDPTAAAYDEGQRFPVCHPDRLLALFEEYGFDRLTVNAIEIPTHFNQFDEYWQPFLRGQFPAPQYVASLSEDQRMLLRSELQQLVPANADGAIDLIARAWMVSGTRMAHSQRISL